MCCDEQAVAATGDRVGYARALTALAEVCRRPPSLASSGLAMGAGGNGSFSARIRRVLGQPARDRVALPAWLGGGLAVVLLLIAGVAGVTWAGDRAQETQRLTATMIAPIIRDFAYQENPKLAPGVKFGVTEIEVPDLWIALKSQVFHVRYLRSPTARNSTSGC